MAGDSEVSEGVVRTLLRDRLGVTVTQLTPIPTGWFNTTFVARVEPAATGLSRLRPDKVFDSVVVRIAPPDDRGALFYEKRMMRQLHERLVGEGFPVPEVFCHDFSRELIARDVLVMERMEGTPMSELRKSNAARTYQQLGSHLGNPQPLSAGPHRWGAGRLHGLLCDAHGYVGAHAPCPTADNWWDAFVAMWDALLSDLSGESEAYTAEEARSARDLLRRHAPAFRSRSGPSRLLHMDIWQENILIDREGNVTAVLDWDRSCAGDPEIEYAVLDYCGMTRYGFWDAYKAAAPTGLGPNVDPAYDTRLMFYSLYEIQKYMVIAALRRKSRAQVRSYKSQCMGMLRLLER